MKFAPRASPPSTPSSTSASHLSFELSFGALCGLLCAWAVAMRVLLVPLPPHDFWWHMAQGRAAWATGRVPTVDAFSHTRAGEEFFNQSWLAQVFFHAAHTLGGVPLLIALQAAIVTVGYALVWTLARRRAAEEGAAAEESAGRRKWGAKAASLIGLGVIVVSFDNWLLRPQTLCIPIFAAWLWTLEKWRRNEISPALLIASQFALMIGWANAHGSFPLALALNGATLAGAWLDARRAGSADGARQPAPNFAALLLASVAAAGAILLNPRGAEVLGYVRMMLSHPSNRFSAEWLSPTPRNGSDALFFVFALAVFIALAHARRRPLWSDTARLALFFWLALTSGRYILWFAIVAALPLASTCARPGSSQVLAPGTTRTSRRLNALVALIAWLGLVPLLPWFKPTLGLPAPLGLVLSDETPVRAAQVLAALKPRRPWHNAPTGSYLAWATPGVKTWIDTRFELFPPHQWRDYLAAQEGDARVLDKYRCDAALVDLKTEAALDRALQKRGWKSVFRDSRFCIRTRP
jgi:hypothetical protein